MNSYFIRKKINNSLRLFLAFLIGLVCSNMYHSFEHTNFHPNVFKYEPEVKVNVRNLTSISLHHSLGMLPNFGNTITYGLTYDGKVVLISYNFRNDSIENIKLFNKSVYQSAGISNRGLHLACKFFYYNHIRYGSIDSSGNLIISFFLPDDFK
jgi:hypothetical protein